MKNILLSLMVLLLSGTLWANMPLAELDSEIRSVTIFRSGAQIFRSGEGQVPAGQSILKFTGLSPYVNAASVQFSATGDFTILSVNFQQNFINPLENNEEVNDLKTQLEALDEQLRKLEIEQEVLKEEEALILANKQIGSQQNGVQLQDLQAIAEYYRTRLKAIKLELFDLRSEAKQLTEEKNKIAKQIGQMTRENPNRASGEIWIKVTADRPVTSKFQLSYMVSRAGWKPAYDVRVADVGEDVLLDLKGNVFQSTGEDWRGVSLSLSTGVPTESGVKPELQPWWLAPYQPVVYQSGARERRLDGYALKDKMEMEDATEMAAPPPPPPPPPPAPEADYAAVEQFERTTTREYRISLPYDIPSDGNPYTVAIEKYELPAEYQYYVAPKLDKDVFLTAKVGGWEEYNLLSGPANLFFEGSYLGNTYLDVNQTTDTLELSLGRDKGIIVSREKDEQFKDKQFIGNKVTQNIGWKIELRNTKSKVVRIVIEDQFPISTNEDIEIDLDSPRGATVNREKGTLTWQINLVPGQSETLRFRYEVKYPKKMGLILE
ncbi:DUF4139 domain-containing protein [Flavilitoribacter nigricans]|nr:DUF4139 domain-containing protein [Flavilitoribacter nigricans]